MFLEERMVDQFFYCGSIAWILLKAAVEEVADLGTYEEVWGYFDFIFDNFDKLLLSCYFEGDLAYYHLVHHDTDWPDIYLLIVLLPFEDLGADVERCPTKSGTKFVVLVDWPSEITEFDDILNKDESTSWRTMF